LKNSISRGFIQTKQKFNHTVILHKCAIEIHVQNGITESDA